MLLCRFAHIAFSEFKRKIFVCPNIWNSRLHEEPDEQTKAGKGCVAGCAVLLGVVCVSVRRGGEGIHQLIETDNHPRAVRPFRLLRAFSGQFYLSRELDSTYRRRRRLPDSTLATSELLCVQVR